MMNELASFPLRGLVELVLAGRPWRVREDDRWCHLIPPEHRPRVQGWKLHVSATVVSAPMVLQRAAAVLVANGCAFKFSRTLDKLADLTGKEADPAQAGKFLTAYPHDDDHLRLLAQSLDRATAGLPGPAILSDRPYRKASLVHYRYGAFVGVPVLTNGGTLEVWLRAPDGSLVEDTRQAWFCPPAWAQPPLPGPPARPSQLSSDPQPVLLADRFEVFRTVVTSARGGVYRAVDRQTGDPVVIKRARPHIRGLVWQGDAREGLHREADLLTRLDGLAPRLVTTFTHDGNAFLVMEEVPGQPLSVWLRHRLRRQAAAGDGSGLPVAEVLAMAGELAGLVDAVHARGLVYRDLTTDNVMVTDDGALRLVDAELAATRDEWVAPAHTPGFGAPEIATSVAPAPDPSADHYALGASIFHLAVGLPPTVPPDSAPARPARDRLAEIMRCAGADIPAARALAPAVIGLTDPDPATRWSVPTLREWLREPHPRADGPPGGPSGCPGPGHLRRLHDDGLAYLVAHLDTAARDWLFWPGEQGMDTDPCNVQHGAAGVLAVLTRAAAHGAGETDDGSLRDVVAGVASWIDSRLMSVPRLLPGLYFGRAGTAWALYDAARLLDDERLADRAVQLARAVPVEWPCPDVCHGMAGAGLAHLHLWRHSRDRDLAQRIHEYIDRIQAAATVTQGRLHWPIPDSFLPGVTGFSDYGFAHGVAGVGAFLLAAGILTGRDDAVATARRAGDTLVAGAVRDAEAAYWPNRVFEARPDGDLRYHWCSGASGVGTFLLRLWRATGEPSYLDLARAGALTVRSARWTMGPSVCHGLAGNGEFLLDLADTCGHTYREWAEELAACLYVRHAVRNGRLVVADDPQTENVSLAYNTGLAGVVGFLMRLHHGGPRWWMADEQTVS